VRMSKSIMDYIFRRLALDYLDFDARQALGIYSADERQRYLETGSYELVSEVGNAAEVIGDLSAPVDAELVEPLETKDTHGTEQREVPAAPVREAHTSAELLEKITGTAVDSPLCMTCGTKMRPAGSCYVCEGCGSTSGCS
jgi:ribonucleoside-diphosphate reductase alpha chain